MVSINRAPAEAANINRAPAEAANDGGGRGLVIHTVGPLEQDTLTGILRSATNARAALTPGTGIEVVVQGPGVKLLATNSPATEAVKSARQLDVSVLACGNSMRSARLEEKDLAPGIGMVPAAIAHLTQRQWDGWAYARL
ncbi:DsrE family protein [Specibacter sp. NPDC078692]|uniref:DsrE family protein n=1 Tax=Specibacter sp. NPDC078692 TaxID=3155818 RepID=UPI003417EAD1